MLFFVEYSDLLYLRSAAFSTYVISYGCAKLIDDGIICGMKARYELNMIKHGNDIEKYIDRIFKTLNAILSEDYF